MDVVCVHSSSLWFRWTRQCQSSTKRTSAETPGYRRQKKQISPSSSERLWWSRLHNFKKRRLMYYNVLPPAGLFFQKKHVRLTKHPRCQPASQAFCREPRWNMKTSLCLTLNKKTDAEQKSQVLKWKSAGQTVFVDASQMWSQWLFLIS